jgi:hypothetical protein
MAISSSLTKIEKIAFNCSATICCLEVKTARAICSDPATNLQIRKSSTTKYFSPFYIGPMVAKCVWLIAISSGPCATKVPIINSSGAGAVFNNQMYIHRTGEDILIHRLNFRPVNWAAGLQLDLPCIRTLGKERAARKRLEIAALNATVEM